MERRNLSQILKDAKIDYRREYDRLYEIFYELGTGKKDQVLRDACANAFWNMPMRGTCLSLDDFDEVYGIHFEKEPHHFDLNYLLDFCEYTYNLVIYTSFNAWEYGVYTPNSVFLNQLDKVVELIGYKFLHDNDTSVDILVPCKQEALAVAEIVDEKLSYSVLEYNHHSLEGNVAKKKAILKLFADDIEPQRKILNSINKTLSDNLFQMFQKFVRHNNEDNPYIKSLSPKEIEDCYDDIYQMWLLAKLEIDNLDRKKRVADVLQKINSER